MSYLNESQRAMVAANIANLENGQAGKDNSSANLQTLSRAKAAEMLNVSERSVNTAKKVQWWQQVLLICPTAEIGVTRLQICRALLEPKPPKNE